MSVEISKFLSKYHGGAILLNAAPHRNVCGVSNTLYPCTLYVYMYRGPIQRIDNVSPTTASAALSILPDKRTLAWTIGEHMCMSSALTLAFCEVCQC